MCYARPRGAARARSAIARCHSDVVGLVAHLRSRSRGRSRCAQSSPISPRAATARLPACPPAHSRPFLPWRPTGLERLITGAVRPPRGVLDPYTRFERGVCTPNPPCTPASRSVQIAGLRLLHPRSTRFPELALLESFLAGEV